MNLLQPKDGGRRVRSNLRFVEEGAKGEVQKMIFASEGVRWRWEKLRRAHEMRGAEGDLVLGELHTTDIILYPCKYICVILLEVITMKKIFVNFSCLTKYECIYSQ